MSKLDHFVIVRMAEQDLSEGKNPPICDACNESIEKQEDGLFNVQCLILEDRENASFWGVICDRCRKLRI